MKYGTGEYIIKPSSARYSSAYNTRRYNALIKL